MVPRPRSSEHDGHGLEVTCFFHAIQLLKAIECASSRQRYAPRVAIGILRHASGFEQRWDRAVAEKAKRAGPGPWHDGMYSRPGRRNIFSSSREANDSTTRHVSSGPKSPAVKGQLLQETSAMVEQEKGTATTSDSHGRVSRRPFYMRAHSRATKDREEEKRELM